MYAGKTEKRIYIFYFLEHQDRLLFARVEIGVTEFPTKTTKKEEAKNGSEIFLTRGCAFM